MILEFSAVEGNRVLDVVTIEDDKVSYRTGDARTVLSGPLRRYGVAATALLYRSWSNGYVKFSERV